MFFIFLFVKANDSLRNKDKIVLHYFWPFLTGMCVTKQRNSKGLPEHNVLVSQCGCQCGMSCHGDCQWWVMASEWVGVVSRVVHAPEDTMNNPGWVEGLVWLWVCAVPYISLCCDRRGVVVVAVSFLHHCHPHLAAVKCLHLYILDAGVMITYLILLMSPGQILIEILK